MKRFFDWQVVFGLALIFLTVFFYGVHYLIFRDVHHIFIYLVGDIAFVFFEVLLVTLVLHRLLRYREKRAMLKKLNMVIGAFFSEVGTELLKMLSSFDKENSKMTRKLIITKDWTDKEFLAIGALIRSHQYVIDAQKGDLEALRLFLKEKRPFLLGLLENPNLLEHESFTNLLWAVFHLTEELIQRRSLKGLPGSDYEHLAGDIKRIYLLLIEEWLRYMEHLQTNYPYLFSLAMRTNPFDATASVEVK
jgi:hypothetical protein